MSSFWDALGQRLNDGSLTKRELLMILGDLHSIDHATDEMLSYILYKGYPNWLSNDKEKRSHDYGLGTKEQIKQIIREHQKIQKRYKAKE
jgi:hypothetical protein